MASHGPFPRTGARLPRRTGRGQACPAAVSPRARRRRHIELTTELTVLIAAPPAGFADSHVWYYTEGMYFEAERNLLAWGFVPSSVIGAPPGQPASGVGVCPPAVP